MQLNWRSQRQIIIFSIYFLIIFIPFIFFTYQILKKQPSCFDKIQNADEQGIDCNGSCELRCEGTYREAKINFVRGLKVADNIYDIFALVENYNTEINFPNLPYSLTFYSKEGKVLGNATGSLALLPRSKGAIYIPSLQLEQEPKTIDLNLEPHKALAFKDTESIPQNISVENWQAQRGANNSLQVVGEIKNPNNKQVKNITAYALLYDDTKTVYAVSRTKIVSLAGREKAGIAFTWGDIMTPKNVDFVVVFDN